MSLLPGQLRAARALIGWSQDQLAEASKVAKATIANFEAGKRQPYDRTLDDIRAALEAAGVEFLPENGGGAGVRLKRGGKPSVDAENKADSATYNARMAEINEYRDNPMTPEASAKVLKKGKRQ